MERILTEIGNYLLHQSWQIAALFVIVASACWVLRRASAHWRYLLWLIVLAKCIVPPMLSLQLAVLPGEPAAQSIPQQVQVAAVETTTEPAAPTAISYAPPAATGETAPAAVSDAAPSPSVSAGQGLTAGRVEQAATFSIGQMTQWLAIAWACGVGLYGLVVFIKAGRLNRRLKLTRRDASDDVQAELADLAKLLGLKTLPRVYHIDDMSQPFVWGLLRGSIYLPAEFSRSGSRDDQRGILAHELAHVRRYDAAVNALQIVVQGVLFFHPLVWWANKKVRQEREKCCDETAIAALALQPKQYGSAIVDVLMSASRASRPVPSLAIAGPVKNIEERIGTIMAAGRKFHRRPTIIAIATTLLLAAIVLPPTLKLTTRQALAAGLESSKPVVNKPTEDSSGRAVATFSSGITAELVAVSKLGTKTPQWWKPDGSVLDKAPCATMADAPEQYRYELVMRLNAPKGVSYRWRLPDGKASTDTGMPKDSEGKEIENLRRAGVGWSSDSPKTVRFGVAAGKWQTKAETDGSGDASISFADGGVVFAKPYSQDGTTHLTVARTQLSQDVRIVATDIDGREHPHRGVSGGGVSGMVSHTYRFPQLPVARIERFQFQTRPYEWVEFRNVSLVPGKATRVQIVEDRPGSTAEIYAGVTRRYIGRKVADFGAGVDLSSPEAAAASWNRAWGTADANAIIQLSSHKWSRGQVKGFFKRREAIYDKALLDSTVVEVLIYKQNLANVITYLPFPEGKGNAPYSLRSFGLFEGKWKNLGEDRLSSVEAARENVNRTKDNIWRQYQSLKGAADNDGASSPEVPSTPLSASDPAVKKLKGYVERFFSRNYRDITARKIIEWGKPRKLENGNLSIRYKYHATIWDKDKIINNQIFTFTKDGKFVSVKDAAKTPATKTQPESFGRAEKIADLFMANEFEKVIEHFDAGMKKALPISKLKSVRKQLDDAGGAFKKRGAVHRQEKVDGYNVLFVPLIWEKNRIDLKVVLAADGQVTGLWTVTPQPENLSAAEKTPATQPVR